MCILSSIATVCQDCRRLVVYGSKMELCPPMYEHVKAGGSEPEDRECLAEPEDETRYVPNTYCKHCNPPPSEDDSAEA
ncbi:hypothetical protein ACHAPU_005384 [Fusarium lateritium]